MFLFLFNIFPTAFSVFYEILRLEFFKNLVIIFVCVPTYVTFAHFYLVFATLLFFHLIPFIVAFLILFLKIWGLKVKVRNNFACNCFHLCMVLFTKEYFPISFPCFLSLIFRTWSILLNGLGLLNLSCITPSPFPSVSIKKRT